MLSAVLRSRHKLFILHGTVLKGKRVNVLIHIDSRSAAESIHQSLTASGHDAVVVSRESLIDWFTPDVLLVDIAMLTHDLLVRYSQAQAFLVDTCREAEELCGAFIWYATQSVLLPHAGLREVWIENGSVKVSLLGTGPAVAKAENGRRL